MQNLYIGKVAKYEKFTKYGFCAAREKPEGGSTDPPGAPRVKKKTKKNFLAG